MEWGQVLNRALCGPPCTNSRPDPFRAPSVQSIAVCAIDFYTGDRFPRWRNDLLVSSLAAEELRRLVLEGSKVAKQEVLFKGIGRVRDVVSGPDGLVYVAFNSPSASPGSCPPPPEGVDLRDRSRDDRPGRPASGQSLATIRPLVPDRRSVPCPVSSEAV